MRSDKIRSAMALVFVFMLIVPMVSAGVGISWDRESSLVPENTKTCLTYKVYNPWEEDSYVQIKVSDALTDIIKSAESETKFVPKQTSSSEAMPVTFCFKTPKVYARDCLIGDSLICKQTCEEPMKLYQGEVEVIELSEEEAKIGGTAGGSATQMSVSAPLRVRVQCIPHDRNYSAVYVLIALIAGILLALNIMKQKKKSKRKAKKKSSKKKK